MLKLWSCRSPMSETLVVKIMSLALTEPSGFLHGRLILYGTYYCNLSWYHWGIPKRLSQSSLFFSIMSLSTQQCLWGVSVSSYSNGRSQSRPWVGWFGCFTVKCFLQDSWKTWPVFVRVQVVWLALQLSCSEEDKVKSGWVIFSVKVDLGTILSRISVLFLSVEEALREERRCCSADGGILEEEWLLPFLFAPFATCSVCVLWFC